MKKAILFIVLLSGIFYSSNIYGQGWVWGKGNSGGPVDSWPIAADGSGNVFGAGYTIATGYSTTFGSYTLPPSLGIGEIQTVWVKYSSAGTVLWAGATISGNTYPYNIATDPSGNLIVFGAFNTPTMQIGTFTLTKTQGPWQYYLAKISPSGTVLWAINDGVSYGGPLPFLTSYFMTTGGVATDAAGNIFITSSFTSPTMTIGTNTLTNMGASGYTDIFVAKYSPAGTLLWAKSIGGTDNDYGCGITVAASGNVYITGPFNSHSVTVGPSVIGDPYGGGFAGKSSAYIAEFSGTTGAPLWAEAAGGPNGAFGMGLTSDVSGNVYMTGGFADVSISFGSTTIDQTYPVAGKQALYLVQISPANVVTWSKTIGSPTRDLWGFCIALASCGQVWVSGDYSDTANIDGNKLAPVAGPDPVFIAGYNLSGGVVGYSGLGSGADDQNGIAADASGNIYICSDYQNNGSVGIIIGPDTLPPLPGAVVDEHFYIGKFSFPPPDSIFTHKDTTIECSAISEILTAPSGYSNYYWDDGSLLPTRTITGPGTYWVYNSTVPCGSDVLVDTFYVSTAASDTLFRHQDTSVCVTTGTATLTAPPGYSLYSWSTGATISSVVATIPGTYVAFCTSGCHMLIDTFYFSLTTADSTFSHTDTGACITAGKITLTAPAGYTSCLWSTGSIASSISVTASGNYWVINKGLCAILTDTFHVDFAPAPVVSLSNYTSICAGEVITIGSPQPPGTQYAWSSGSTDSSINISGSGYYSLTVSLYGCSATASFEVSIIPLPVVSLGPDTTVCHEYNLKVPVNSSGATYLWSDGSTGQSIQIFETGTYWVTISNTCGSTTDSINVTIGKCDIGLPTGFSPNGDGKNDVLYIRGLGIKTVDLRIFNRWGQLVFETTSQNVGWDGTFGGAPQPEEVYAYLLTALMIDGTTKEVKGNVTLLR